MDRKELGRFLRSRREAMRVTDVGLVAGTRRRTPGLRREEIAGLANISTNYYERIEQGRGGNPSEQLIGSLARALRLDVDERDHLYSLAGFPAPPAYAGAGYVDPGLMYLLDALVATPAQITDDLSFVLAQNQLAQALVGPWADQRGLAGNVVWRWFTDPSSRSMNPESEWDELSRTYAADLRASIYRRGQDEASRRLLGKLLATSPEFAALWEQGDVAVLRSTRKRLRHPQVGELDVQCDVVASPGTGHRLVVWRPQPGGDAAEKIEFLRVLGASIIA
ncbi:XRE family transcriptional regulator [Micromonospora sp. 15K316]|nr:XRE family transcriptional regulator [Micromonospora sp. 15K316]